METLSFKQPWETSIRKTAMKFVLAVDKNFKAHIKFAEQILPDQSKEARMELLNVMIDALVTTAVSIAAAYVNKTEFFEDQFVSAVRDKFAIIRKQELGELVL